MPEHDIEMDCPKCGTKVYIRLDWKGGECPSCGESYWQDELCTEDYSSDCGSEIYWEYWDL